MSDHTDYTSSDLESQYQDALQVLNDRSERIARAIKLNPTADELLWELTEAEGVACDFLVDYEEYVTPDEQRIKAQKASRRAQEVRSSKTSQSNKGRACLNKMATKGIQLTLMDGFEDDAGAVRGADGVWYSVIHMKGGAVDQYIIRRSRDSQVKSLESEEALAETGALVKFNQRLINVDPARSSTLREIGKAKLM